MTQSQGAKMRQLLKEEKPLQVVGAINAYSAMLARDAGHKAIYLSGAGVANASFGLPDLGMTNLADVCEDARRITGAVDLPLLVDIDVGWGNAFNIARTIKEMERAGVAAVHVRTARRGGCVNEMFRNGVLELCRHGVLRRWLPFNACTGQLFDKGIFLLCVLSKSLSTHRTHASFLDRISFPKPSTEKQ